MKLISIIVALNFWCIGVGFVCSSIIGCVNNSAKKHLVIQENKKILYNKDSVVEVIFAAVETHKVDYYRNDSPQVDIQKWIIVDWPDSVLHQTHIVRVKNKNGKWLYYSHP